MNKQEIDKAIEILKYYNPVGAINAGFIEEPNEDAKAFHLAISALEKTSDKNCSRCVFRNRCAIHNNFNIDYCSDWM